MFVNGSKEWIGENGYAFLSVRTAIEYRLLSLGYDYFYGGMISKASVYEKHMSLLGEHFRQVFIPFEFKNTPYIITPEYTFRVYEYLERNQLLNGENRIFYSQEMMRNEAQEDIQAGKTFSFWQIGFELFGTNEKALSLEALVSTYKTLAPLSLQSLTFRYTDKRIFKALCKAYGVEDPLSVSLLLDRCHESGDLFYESYVAQGGDQAFAKCLRTLLNQSAAKQLTFDDLYNATDDLCAREALKDLKALESAFEKATGKNCLSLVVYMPKTWDAYTHFIFDVRVAKYDKAIAGGGSLWIDPYNPFAVHSGVGIGVTRIVEHLIDQETFVERESAS